MNRSRQPTRPVPFQLDLPEGRIEGQIELPLGHLRLVDLASLALELSRTVADIGARVVADLGLQISCRKGCGACCRQPVPLSPPEAFMLEELVASLPEHIRPRIRARFAAAAQGLQTSGRRENSARLQDPSCLDDENMEAITRAYFAQQIPCPFLEDESCSIYASQPSRCREFLVTSPARHCLDPYQQRVDRVPISIRLSEVLARLWADATQTSLQLVPLPLALNWSADNQDLKGVGAKAHEMLDLPLFRVAQIAAERERETLKGLNDNASSRRHPRLKE